MKVVACEHFIEAADMIGNPIREPPVAGRSEHQAPAKLFLFSDPAEHFLVVRNRGGIKQHALRNPLFQVCFTPKQPKRNTEKIKRIFPHKH
jgi:hypothetical protein